MVNMFVDGEWRTDAYELADDDGEFDRDETSFRNWVGGERVRDGEDPDPDAEFPVESGRYHLYVSYACPWAHRTLVTRALKGLEDAVSVDVVDPYRDDDGWQFTPEKEGCTEDTVNGFDYLREAYVAADENYTGRVSVPVLWDKKQDTIVNNESEEVMRMLDVAFDDLATRDVDLYPEGHREDVDRAIEEIYDPINNGVYRAGFAETQEAYERAVGDLFDALDRWEAVLGEQRYLVGDVLTEADVAMFTTLVRFDDVYHTHFKCNRRKVAEYPNVWNYLCELYQLPGVAETVHMDHINEHYYTTHTDVNPKRIVAVGPAHDFWADHDRSRLAGGPPDALSGRTPADD
ncbi:glutathione S-transferase family protein [Halomarina oriensis]|uniref:Glutathione S-transferase family protein n=1 Tax=Halomarina oriensis TaxID=671145 RepID=A0A6B0GNA1_9EURY|nr:glutathione S-transferase family protein [Halomarina oriensis]MWG34979.1 glutathione S-transferase family protein [Halomarina oriensis]